MLFRKMIGTKHAPNHATIDMRARTVLVTLSVAFMSASTRRMRTYSVDENLQERPLVCILRRKGVLEMWEPRRRRMSKGTQALAPSGEGVSHKVEQ